MDSKGFGKQVAAASDDELRSLLDTLRVDPFTSNKSAVYSKRNLVRAELARRSETVAVRRA